MKLIALVRQVQEVLYMILDDSKNTERDKHVQAAFHLFDYTTKRYLWRHQLIIPYAIELYRSKSNYHEAGKAMISSS